MKVFIIILQNSTVPSKWQGGWLVARLQIVDLKDAIASSKGRLLASLLAFDKEVGTANLTLCHLQKRLD